MTEAADHAFRDVFKARLPDRSPVVFALFSYAMGVGKHFESLLGQSLAESDLDGAQFRVLYTLWFAQPPYRRSPTTLSRILLQSPSGMTHTLRRLRHAKLIERVADPADERAKQVQLTAAGVETVRTQMNRVLQDLTTVYGDFTDEKLEELAEAQRLLVERVALWAEAGGRTNGSNT